MRPVHLLLAIIFTGASLSSAGLAFGDVANPDAEKVRAEYRKFSAMAGRVMHDEPTLVANTNFDQKFTLKYQRYAGGQEVTQFKMIFSVDPSAVKLNQLLKAYAKYGAEATSLGEELPNFLHNHVAMITDRTYAADYRRRYRQVAETIFSGTDGSLREFKVFDCDYTTQPTDALWYLVHSVELLDRYGAALYGQEWVSKREELRLKNHIRSPEEIREVFQAEVKAGAKQAAEPAAPTEEMPENTSAD